jgi:hypothetical protein
MENETGETPLDRAKRLIQEGWSLRKHMVKGKAYARMRKGNDEIYLGPWIPEFDQLLAKKEELKPTEEKPEEKPKEIREEIEKIPEQKPKEVEKVVEKNLRPLSHIFWLGIGTGWFTILFFILPSLVWSIPSSILLFLSPFLVSCLLLWLSTRLVLSGSSHPGLGRILIYSGMLTIAVVVATTPFWIKSSVAEPEFWYRTAYVALAIGFGLWSITSGGRMISGRETVSR